MVSHTMAVNNEQAEETTLGQSQATSSTNSFSWEIFSISEHAKVI